jgi:hypothetical protein
MSETISNYKGYYIEDDFLPGNKLHLISVYKQNIKKSNKSHAPKYDCIWRFTTEYRSDGITHAKMLINARESKHKRTKRFLK